MPEAPSTRLGLPGPSETDPADVPVDVGKLRDALDPITVVFLQALAGSLPSPSTPGRLFFATDAKQLQYDDGAAWWVPGWSPGDLKVSAAVAPPVGWLLCDGRALARVDYPALYTAIGVAFGAGDGSTTFNVPDLRGRAVMGAGAGPGLTARALGAKVGEEAHTLAVGEMPSHGHGVSDPTHAHTVADPGHAHSVGVNNVNVADTQTGPQGGAVLGGTPLSTDVRGTGIGIYGAATGIGIQANGGSGAHNTMQPSTAVNVFIKT